jgi:hypothetical protein
MIGSKKTQNMSELQVAKDQKKRRSQRASTLQVFDLWRAVSIGTQAKQTETKFME